MTTEYIPLLTFAWAAGEVTEQEFQGEKGRLENRKVVLTMVVRGENELLKERFVLCFAFFDEWMGAGVLIFGWG